MEINNHVCTALVDARATISIIRADLASDLGTAIEKSYLTATGVTKDTLDIIGCPKVKLNIKPEWEGSHEFYVTRNISYEVILGTDLLTKLGTVAYNFTKCTLHINGSKGVPMGEDTTVGHARVCNNIDVPPLTQMIITVRVPYTSKAKKECIFEGCRDQARNLLIGKSICKVDDGKIFVPVLNPTTRTHSIKKDEVIGSVETLEEDLRLLSVPNEQEKETTIKTPLPGDNLKLSDTDLTEAQFTELQELVNEFADIAGERITELGRTSIVQHVVETLPGTNLIRSKPYNIPIGVRAEIKQQLDQMQEENLISPSAGNWTLPVVLVRKKDGNWRFCVDYRKLNSVTVKQSMATSSINNALEIMHDKKYFSSIDLCSGFFQVSLHPGSRKKSGFITPFGCYEFKTMSQGMSGSPATFTRLALAIMADLISEGSSCVYLDDWLMTSKTFQDHIQLLRTVFLRLRYSGLKYRPTKNQLCKREILYLGHLITGEGVTVAPYNTEKIKKFPPPTNKTEVKRLFGLYGYYRSFIKNFSKIAAPITRLLSQASTFNWTTECEEASQFLKTQITSAPILAYPDFSQTFTLTTDASAIAIGAVLSQRSDGREHPVSFFSKSLNKSEKKWDSCEQELYAIVTSVKHFRSYLLNVPFKIFTDNAACTYVLKKPELSPRLARWAIQLSDQNPESRCRCFVKSSNCSHCQHTII